MQKKCLIGFSRYGVFFLFLLTLGALVEVKAQQNGTVSGKISDVNGIALTGASVKVVQLNRVVTTDVSGNYRVQVPAGVYTLEVSFISFVKQKKEQIVVKAATTTSVNFTLQEDRSVLNEVVVTALNIERDKKALGYAVTTIGNEQLTEALSNNWTDALSGKVAGLNLVRSNSGPTGSASIILRGENNLTGSNDALIVVDGVIINGGSGRMSGGSGAYLDETVVGYGSSVEDINPDDIENVTVLKGPGAAALYGSRGANGAVIITTKSGKAKQKGIGVSINSNTAFATINRMPSLQYEYGQGVDGANYFSYGASVDGAATNRTTNAYGPKFNGQYFFQYDPVTNAQATERTLWRPYKKGGFNDFFETAKTFTNSVSIDGGTDKTTARFSYTNVGNTWIIPNTGYDRNTVALSVNSKPSKNLQISSKLNYTNKVSDNLPAGGYNNQSIMYGYIFWAPSAPISWLRNYWVPGKENITQNTPLTSGPDNPYLISYEMLNKQNRNSVTGNVSATYHIAKDFSLMIRTSVDLANDARSQQRPFDTEKFKKGMYRTQDITSREVNSDFLLKYKTKFTKDITVDASVGGAALRNSYNKNEVRADSLLFPGVFTFANSAGPLWTSPYRSSYAINSLYGLVSTSYKDYLFLDVTLRNDWSSLLASPTSRENVSIIYPSANASFILSQVVLLPKQISYLKLRASASGVGSGGNTPYNTAFSFLADPAYSGGLYNPSRLKNPNLKPLYTYSYEAGIELQLFHNRIGLDLAVYTADTKDQILYSLLDQSVGFRDIVVNAGNVRNKGIEIALNGTPVKVRNGLTWNINTTFSANKNKIIELSDYLESFTLQNGPGSNGFIVANVGGSMGDLYGRGYLRSPDGQIVYNSGMPVLSDDLLKLGNTMPQWKGSIQNQFKYKNFSMGFLFDAQYGAVAYSLTQGKMAVQGKTTSTLPGRYNGIVGDGVMRNPDGSYSPNTVVAEDLSAYYDAHFGTSNVEGATFSTDFIKLREARLDYTLKAKAAKKLGLQRATLGVFGRDLFIWSTWPGFDPEFGTLSGSEINRGFETGQFPSTRTFGVNLIVGF
ncbi:SusC/RagA family TonB-linked outer membrane protein [Pedobacter sp. UBA4863]|uniref:SusC/RagA family TonB-linked outer membrane protein n=1 Tax=Pedobacter sp. UBA4863 TaxID=1947060 RepID=UPI0025F892F8|nr:SusC/RagA family TonB-linked outer membrane protein [Pedobacter sp. UBA4863]